jgi:hypothetical protein
MLLGLGNSLTKGGNVIGSLDPDAKTYIAAVEAADGQTLESGVKKAYNTFVKGCKSDGIWDVIKASCIMAGARTLSGALVPLKGTAPTNFNFVSGDYNRETGLLGNGTTKYLDSNRNQATEPQNNFSVGVYITENDSTSNGVSIGADGASLGASTLGATTGSSRNRSSTIFSPSATGFTGFHGTSRNISSNYTHRRIGSSQVVTQTSQTPASRNIGVFCSIGGTGPIGCSTPRMSFYHIGESLDLEKLDSRVTTLMSNIATAIP